MHADGDKRPKDDPLLAAVALQHALVEYLFQVVDTLVRAVDGQADKVRAERDQSLATRQLVAHPLVDSVPGLRRHDAESLHAEHGLPIAHLDPERPFVRRHVIEKGTVQAHLDVVGLVVVRERGGHVLAFNPGSLECSRTIRGELLVADRVDVQHQPLGRRCEHPLDEVRRDSELRVQNVVERLLDALDVVIAVQPSTQVHAIEKGAHEQHDRREARRQNDQGLAAPEAGEHATDKGGSHTVEVLDQHQGSASLSGDDSFIFTCSSLTTGQCSNSVSRMRLTDRPSRRCRQSGCW